MKVLLADFRHALRLYRHTPVSSLMAVVVLAVAMAFVGSFLSLYVDLILKPHPGFEQSGRIVTLGQSEGANLYSLPLELIERLPEDVQSLDAVVGVQTSTYAAGPEGETALIEQATRGFVDGLRPRLALGRGFGPEAHGADAEPVALISYDYWQDVYDGRADVVGTTIAIRTSRQSRQPGQPIEVEELTTDFRIVGVMAREMPGFQIDRVALWVPFERMLALRYDLEGTVPSTSMQTYARRAGGASTRSVARELEAGYSDPPDELRLRQGARLDAVGGLVRSLSQHRDATRQLNLFLAGSVLLALVAAANVSLFLLARAPGRRRELGIRMSVGAPVRRLARQLASEAGLLVVAAAALGLLASLWLTGFLRGLAFLRTAQWRDATLLDWRVLGLVGAFLLLVTLFVSLAPILGLKRMSLAASSRQVRARATLAQRFAGTLQIAIAGTLGGAAIAFGWYLGSLTLGHPGYETRDINIARMSPVASGGSSINVQNFVVESARWRETIATIPGVTAVAFGSMVPGAQTGVLGTSIPHPAEPEERISIRVGSIDSALIDVLGFRLLHGRAPTDNDVGVGVVNQALAQALFDRDDVVGESLPFTLSGSDRVEIVGVLEDLSYAHPSAEVFPTLLTTSNPIFFFGTAAVIESALTPAALQRELQRLIDDGALELRLNSVTPLRELRANVIAADTARSWLTIATATLVVVLAAIGFYGTQRYLVTAGRREYAIRASLGAGPKALGRLVFSRGLMLCLPGLVTGALLAFILVAWLREDFVSPEIPPGAVTLAVVAGLGVLLLAASLGPARQARRTQPAPLLREE